MLPKSITTEYDQFSKEMKLDEKQKSQVLKRIENAYEEAKISPGEAIGIITAESFGEPSTQMCTAYDEKVIIRINNKIKVVKIGEFVDELISLNGALKLNNSEILPLHTLEVYAPSLNQDEKVEWKRIIECSRHIAEKKLMRITTASGREITCTDSHSFVTRINNSIIPIRGTELKRGDRIPVINNFYNKIAMDEIKIDKYIKDEAFVVDSEDLLYKVGTIMKPIKNTIKLDCLTGWYIGAYLAEGACNGNQVGISNIDNNYINNAKKFADNMNINFVDNEYEGEYGPARTLTINSKPLSRVIVGLCSNGSDNKHVPNIAYSASDEFVAGLLRGYFDGDGNFHVDRKMIRASSNSKELRDGIALLLSRFKIFSYKVEDNKGQYWLLIPYKYAPLFLTYINSDIDYKRECLERLAEESKKFWNNYSRDYTDMISGFGDLFWNVAKKLNYPSRYVNNFTKRQKIGRTALFRYMKVFDSLAKEKNINITNDLNLMSRMFNSDVIWDQIVDISYIDYNKEHVYDFSVPGLETFTTFDGIITHNTLNTFHFAGVAEMDITVGLPRLIEIFDARKIPSTPKMEITLKPKFSRTNDMVREVAVRIKETKFGDVVSEFSINIPKLRIEAVMSRKVMRDLGLKPTDVVMRLKEKLKTYEVKEDRGTVYVSTKNKEVELSEIYKLKEKVKELHIFGLKGIKQVLPVKGENTFVVHCAGSNLKNAVEMDEVEPSNVMTNNLFEIADILGIEAARAAIVNEAEKVIKEQGLEINIRHIMFLADVMTRTGVIKGITRSGITGEKESVLARASFETPIKHIITAALVGETDELNSVVENVMLNQPVPLGTGLPTLIAKVKK